LTSISMSWREDRVSAFALSGANCGVQIAPVDVLWRRRPAGHWGPFLLDAKRSDPEFHLSDLGHLYSKSLGEVPFPMRYCFNVKHYIRIPASYDVFAGLCAEGWMGLWHPDAPTKYLAGDAYAWLEFVHVAELEEEVGQDLLVRGRTGGNFYAALDHTWTAKVKRYVTPAVRSEQRRFELLTFLDGHHWLMAESETPATPTELESLF
jgi:hypothetical protein